MGNKSTFIPGTSIDMAQELGRIQATAMVDEVKNQLKAHFAALTADFFEKLNDPLRNAKASGTASYWASFVSNRTDGKPISAATFRRWAKEHGEEPTRQAGADYWNQKQARKILGI